MKSDPKFKISLAPPSIEGQGYFGILAAIFLVMAVPYLTHRSLFVLMTQSEGAAMGLDRIRNEISYMRRQISRQQKEILTLQRAGISTASAEALLSRMQAKVDDLCQQRDRIVGEEKLKRPSYPSDKQLKGTPAHRRM